MRINKYPQKEYKRLYEIYHGIKKRCYNTHCDRYKDYGGRGIKMCPAWLEGGVDVFIDWALKNGYDDSLTIDRIDNDKDYSPENCTWSTYIKQARNKRDTKYVEYHGETKPLAEFCEELNLPYDAIHNRIYALKWDVEKALTTKIKTTEDSFSRMCREHNINPTTARDRIVKFGWSEEEALNIPAMKRGENRRHIAKDYGFGKCPECGKEFKKNAYWHKYCCKDCQYKSNKRRAVDKSRDKRKACGGRQ